jgi:hypothetical protein
MAVGNALSAIGDFAGCIADGGEACFWLTMDLVSIALLKVNLAPELRWLKDPLTSFAQALIGILAANKPAERSPGCLGEKCQKPEAELVPR